jgi:hypothetical protein
VAQGHRRLLIGQAPGLQVHMEPAGHAAGCAHLPQQRDHVVAQVSLQQAHGVSIACSDRGNDAVSPPRPDAGKRTRTAEPIGVPGHAYATVSDALVPAVLMRLATRPVPQGCGKAAKHICGWTGKEAAAESREPSVTRTTGSSLQLTARISIIAWHSI